MSARRAQRDTASSTQKHDLQVRRASSRTSAPPAGPPRLLSSASGRQRNRRDRRRLDHMAEAPGRLTTVEASRISASAKSKKQRSKSGALRRTHSAMKEEQATGHQRVANLRCPAGKAPMTTTIRA